MEPHTVQYDTEKTLSFPHPYITAANGTLSASSFYLHFFYCLYSNVTNLAYYSERFCTSYVCSETENIVRRLSGEICSQSALVLHHSFMPLQSIQ